MVTMIKINIKPRIQAKIVIKQSLIIHSFVHFSLFSVDQNSVG